VGGRGLADVEASRSEVVHGILGPRQKITYTVKARNVGGYPQASQIKKKKKKKKQQKEDGLTGRNI